MGVGRRHIYTARVTRKKLFDVIILQILQWSANSPDLTPIEKIWHNLEQEVEKARPKTKLAESRKKWNLNMPLHLTSGVI